MCKRQYNSVLQLVFTVEEQFDQSKVRSQILSKFQKEFSPAATSQGYFCNWQLPKYVVATALGPFTHFSRSARSPSQLRHLWKVAVLEIAHLGSWHFEVVIWKRPFVNGLTLAQPPEHLPDPRHPEVVQHQHLQCTP